MADILCHCDGFHGCWRSDRSHLALVISGYWMKTVITACSIFFRSKAYDYVALFGAWQNFVVNLNKSVKVSDRAVPLGDSG